jgi:hypothetical protein
MASIPVIISTLSAVIGLSMAGGNAIYYTHNLISGKEVRLNSRHSILLADRANTIAGILQKVNPDIIVSNFGRRMIQTLVDSLEWAYKYNGKSKIKKVFKSSKYRFIFTTYHKAITRDMGDLSRALNIGKYGNDLETGFIKQTHDSSMFSTNDNHNISFDDEVSVEHQVPIVQNIVLEKN